ncbi:PilN domain-containing protein [Neisseria elongata]|uniref:PilN domain-containing protein n=1 Tax=Neisseria elongata TaxID=495 RepID=UPI0006659173|nr:PilN domain-containing protein [Neisseria elongata]
MMDLIKINLLPYREELNQKKKQKFNVLMAASGIIGIGLAVVAFLGISQAISAQESRNAFLEGEIKILDTAIAEIASLKAEKEDFLAKKQKVEELQSKRFEGAQIIDTLNQLIPEGVFLISVSSSNEKNYEIKGKASSDNRIAMFMKSLPSTMLFEQPELLEIKKTDNGQDFVIKSDLITPQNKILDAGAGIAIDSASSESASSASAAIPAEQNASNGGR